MALIFNKIAIFSPKMGIITFNQTQTSFQNHLSMMAVPKLLKCYDCDTTIHRNEYECDCPPDQGEKNGFQAHRGEI
jgi:Zn finger protein HypA/HybF involved in hydrogenase expression